MRLLVAESTAMYMVENNGSSNHNLSLANQRSQKDTAEADDCVILLDATVNQNIQLRNRYACTTQCRRK